MVNYAVFTPNTLALISVWELEYSFFKFQAYGEDNYHTLRTLAEVLEKKDTGDAKQWHEEM